MRNVAFEAGVFTQHNALCVHTLFLHPGGLFMQRGVWGRQYFCGLFPDREANPDRGGEIAKT